MERKKRVVPGEVCVICLESGITISSDMKSDEKFEENLLQGIYQLAVTHYEPENEKLFSKKCGSENLYMSFSETMKISL